MFYKETNFKETPIGRIPKDWEVVKLGEAIEFVKGKKPGEMTEEYKENCLPYLSTEYLRENKIAKFVKHLNDVVLVNDGDLILLWDGSNAGEFFLGKRGVLSSTMVKLELKKKEYNNRFLFYLLKMKENFLKGQTKGTGIPHVERAVLNNLIIPWPSLPEQQKIAEILSTVDEAIQKTNEIITKTERLKKGLMQELLTKGIGHREFKDTEIGRIPKDWEIARLTDDFVEVETGKRAKGGALSTGSVASIGGEHIDNQGNILWDDMKFIPEDFYESLKQGKVKQGDILLVKDGATTGKVAIIRELKHEKVAVNEHVFVIRSKKLMNEFLFYFLFSKFGQIQIRTRFHGLIGGIRRDDLGTVLMPLPPSSEQQKIAEILSTVDKKLEIERKEKAKLGRIRQGLMDLLLTGKIRVEVD